MAGQRGRPRRPSLSPSSSSSNISPTYARGGGGGGTGSHTGPPNISGFGRSSSADSVEDEDQDGVLRLHRRLAKGSKRLKRFCIVKTDLSILSVNSPVKLFLMLALHFVYILTLKLMFSNDGNLFPPVFHLLRWVAKDSWLMSGKFAHPTMTQHSSRSFKS